MVDRELFLKSIKDLRSYIDGLDHIGQTIKNSTFMDAIYESFLGDMIGTFGDLLIRSIVPETYTQKQLDYFSEGYFNLVHDNNASEDDFDSFYDEIMIGEVDEAWSQMYDHWN